MTLQDYLDEKYSKKDQAYMFETLETYDCSHLGLTSLKGIEKFKKLRLLSCNNNNLTSLKGIENLTNLISIDCSHNYLTTIKALEKLERLMTIFLNGNMITDYSVVCKLENLNHLACDDIFENLDDWKENLLYKRRKEIIERNFL